MPPNGIKSKMRCISSSIDQRMREDCERAAVGRQFDLIVDDATHLLEDTLRTLYWLWPSVKPGGLYVVEEWPGADWRVPLLWPPSA